jgi:hypothetical protein
LLWPASISAASVCAFGASSVVVGPPHPPAPAAGGEIISAPETISCVPLPIELWNATSLAGRRRQRRRRSPRKRRGKTLRLRFAVDLQKLLSPPQFEAATRLDAPVCILAGAGSGKTRVITYRIAHLLDLGIPPDAIAALTFTNKAAEEMRERISKLLGDRRTANKLTMGTFHALGLDILRHERKALGYPRGFAVYDQADQLGVVRELMRTVKDLGKDGERRFDVKAILTRISLAKNAMIAPEAYEPREADE